MSVPVPSPAPHGYDYLLHKWTGRCPYGDVCSGCDALGYCTRAQRMNYAPTVATTLAKLTEPGKLFAADEVQVLADAFNAAVDEVEECIAQIEENDDDCDRIERALFGDCENRSADAMVEQADRLTARLTEADRTMRELREALTPFALTSYGEFLPGTGAVTATIQYADLTLARAALAGERGDRHNETGGTASSPRDESGQA